MPKAEWQMVGCVWVDAGLVWVGDPCYLFPACGEERQAVGLQVHPAPNDYEEWHGFCHKLHPDPEFPATNYVPVQQWNYLKGHPGLGVSVMSGYGDGVYPVYVRYAEDGRPAAVMVEFISEEEEADEEE